MGTGTWVIAAVIPKYLSQRLLSPDLTPGACPHDYLKEEELEKDITCAKFAHMGKEGDQPYEYTAYNLDVIISVGYRVFGFFFKNIWYFQNKPLPLHPFFIVLDLRLTKVWGHSGDPFCFIWFKKKFGPAIASPKEYDLKGAHRTKGQALWALVV